MIFPREDMKLGDYIIDLLTCALIVLFVVLAQVEGGIFILVCILFVIFCVSMMYHRFTLKFRPFYLYLLSFVLYTYLTSLWSECLEDPIEKGNTLLSISLFSIVIYECYKDDNSYRLLKITMWSGFFLSVYAIVFYGYDYILTALILGERLDEQFANVNEIAVMSVISIVISFFFLINKKTVWLSFPFVIPSLFVILGCASRKALVMLLVGIFLVLVLRNVTKAHFKSTLIKIFVGASVVGLIIYFISSFSFADRLNSRMEGLVASYTGEGTVDNSTYLRMELRKTGVDVFSENPVLGVGIGCPHHYARKAVGDDLYLHNNYLELLAGGGLIGFLIFYSCNFYFLRIFRYLKWDIYSEILTILLLLLVIKDYGSVTYYTKVTYIYYILFFTYIERKAKFNNKNISQK